ncbi:hypothetical protein AKJ09_06225 [Labilithrix luteola]|uniref:Tetratricopeptide repeat protein n=1 Tax=Labilithrix luteola TaxID=1391654 RepID=A0A0K1Q1P2_9BACT|nr:hypothetical protein AKJ09_06225 [Labilithrix luteola]
MWRRLARGSALVIGLLAPAFIAVPARADAPSADPLDPLRERFRVGIEQYRANQFADAIVTWEGIYRELGPSKGYRLAFNLARAYDAIGDRIPAAEHYDTYLAEVGARRAAGEALESTVEHQEAESKERLAALLPSIGRIHVLASTTPIVVQIDTSPPRTGEFTVYVAPHIGHSVTFGTGKDAERREVVVDAGTTVELSPPPPVVRSDAPPAQPRFETRVEHPFSPVVLWVAGGITVASLALPAALYMHALSIQSEHDDNPTSPDEPRLRADYNSARSATYASYALPGALAVATGGLVAWYVLGAKEQKVPAVVPQASATAHGLTLGASGSF